LIAWDRLADCYVNTGRADEAIGLYQRLLTVQPDQRSARIGLARAHRLAGHLAQARDLLMAELTPSQSTDAEIHFELAAVFEQLGQVNSAIRNYQVAATDPNYQRQSFFQLSALHRQIGQHEKAAEYLKRAQAARPADPRMQSGFKTMRRTP
jgi:tetratricopeptide (TPR) repeat protein